MPWWGWAITGVALVGAATVATVALARPKNGKNGKNGTATKPVWYWAVDSTYEELPGPPFSPFVIPKTAYDAQMLEAAIKLPGHFMSFDGAKQEAEKFIREQGGTPRALGA